MTGLSNIDHRIAFYLTQKMHMVGAFRTSDGNYFVAICLASEDDKVMVLREGRLDEIEYLYKAHIVSWRDVTSKASNKISPAEAKEAYEKFTGHGESNHQKASDDNAGSAKNQTGAGPAGESQTDR